MVSDHMSRRPLLQPRILALGQYDQEPGRSKIKHILCPDSCSSSYNRMDSRTRTPQSASVDRHRNLHPRCHPLTVYHQEKIILSGDLILYMTKSGAPRIYLFFVHRSQFHPLKLLFHNQYSKYQSLLGAPVKCNMRKNRVTFENQDIIDKFASFSRQHLDIQG